MASAACACEVRQELYVPRLTTVESIEPVTDTEALIRLAFADGSSLGHQPGQFVQVSIPGIGEAPISIASAPCDDPTFELCVRKIGDVTTALHRLQAGAFVGIRGPFGNGFPDDDLHGKDVLVVAGGIGLVPVRPLIHHIVCSREDYGKFTILYGMRRPDEMLFRDELAAWTDDETVDLRMSVDRSHPDWKGHVGVVTTLFPDLEVNPAETVAVVVGPPIMFRFVIAELRLKGVPDDRIILSLERRMKCGVGKCGHCQINNKYVCVDGPVFSYHELKYMWEAI